MSESGARKVPDSSPISALLSQCNPTAEVYVTHIDKTNVTRRKRHFLVMVAMNLSYSWLILRRAYWSPSRYTAQFALGKIVPAVASPPPPINGTFFWTLAVDSLIFLMLTPLVREFVNGLAMFRCRHGFPQEEIVFRALSQAAITNIFSASQERRDTYMQDLLKHATNPEEMTESLYGLPWEEWIYDYKAMAAARQMVKEGNISAKSLDICIWMKMKDGWTVVESARAAKPLYQAGMMEKLKNRLQAMGKIQVFYQMMEVIQLKTLSKDGKPLPVTEEVDTIIADIFKNNGIDFEKLTTELAKEPPKPASKQSKKTD